MRSICCVTQMIRLSQNMKNINIPCCMLSKIKQTKEIRRKVKKKGWVETRASYLIEAHT